ncbi:MAG: biotin--[acetyl-CoA-carboxylase] ligase [Planctomycetota bacterium]|nr:biotin--[acetyl-CoA-carboxylase] ligase [Planctomycetota bacterium]
MEHRVIRHGVIDSSSERAFAALKAGDARHGDVHVARAQTHGRGRRGRNWDSPAGEGLYASLVLLPEPPGLHPAALTMAAGLAVLDLLAEADVAGGSLKWPNDVEVDGAKLAGILVEARGLDPERPHYVLGIGINVLQTEFPPELMAERAVTSLALQGAEGTVEETLERLLPRIDLRISQCRERMTALVADYLLATGLAGCEVTLRRGEESIRGRLEGLSIENGVALGVAGEKRHVALEHVTALDRV